jgi:hypothetical protein
MINVGHHVLTGEAHMLLREHAEATECFKEALLMVRTTHTPCLCTPIIHRGLAGFILDTVNSTCRSFVPSRIAKICPCGRKGVKPIVIWGECGGAPPPKTNKNAFRMP